MVDINCIAREFNKININIHKFNYVNIILIVISAIISSVGLLTNNYQSVIASKIIGLALIPFISLCIIIITLDAQKIIQKSANCFGFILICLFIGMIAGMINAHKEYVKEPTPEMLSRSQFKYESIYLELFISFVAGIGIYYAIVKTSIVALIGLVLVISIIPAICNAGLFYGMALYEHITTQGITKHYENNLTSNSVEKNKKDLHKKDLHKKDLYIDYGNHSMSLFISDITGVFCGFLTMFLVNCF